MPHRCVNTCKASTRRSLRKDVSKKFDSHSVSLLCTPINQPVSLVSLEPPRGTYDMINDLVVVTFIIIKGASTLVDHVVSGSIMINAALIVVKLVNGHLEFFQKPGIGDNELSFEHRKSLVNHCHVPFGFASVACEDHLSCIPDTAHLTGAFLRESFIEDVLESSAGFFTRIYFFCYCSPYAIMLVLRVP
jgi:hypothetical protein